MKKAELTMEQVKDMTIQYIIASDMVKKESVVADLENELEGFKGHDHTYIKSCMEYLACAGMVIMGKTLSDMERNLSADFVRAEAENIKTNADLLEMLQTIIYSIENDNSPKGRSSLKRLLKLKKDMEKLNELYSRALGKNFKIVK